MLQLLSLLPSYLWLLVLILGVVAWLLSRLPRLIATQHLLKPIATVLVTLALWLCGAQYAHRTWQAAAQELQAQVAAAQAQAQAVAARVETRVVTRTQVVKQRGRDVVQYIEREVTKGDVGCVIPPEFVSAHNRAAETP